MSGGGFLKHGIDVFKYNRSLQRKEAHKPFEKKNDLPRKKDVTINDDRKMSPEVLREIDRENEKQNRLEKYSATAFIAVIAIASLACLCYMLWT